MWPRQGKTEIPGSNWVTHHLALSWNVEGTLGMAHRQHLGSLNQPRWKGKEVKVIGKTGWGFHLTILLGKQWPGDDGLCFAQSNMCLTWSMQVVLLRVDALWSGPSHNSLILQGNFQVAGTLRSLKCLTHACTILIGLVIIWKEVKKWDPHLFGW